MGTAPLRPRRRRREAPASRARTIAFRRRRPPEPTPAPAPAPAAAPETAPLSAGEIGWIDQQREVVRLLAQLYTGEQVDVPSIGQLDEIVGAFLDDEPQRVSAKQVANGVGVAFGEHLASVTGMAWVIATGEAGTDLALHGPGDLLVFPVNVIAKRLDARERSFVGPLFDAMVEQVRRVRSQMP